MAHRSQRDASGVILRMRSNAATHCGIHDMLALDAETGRPLRRYNVGIDTDKAILTSSCRGVAYLPDVPNVKQRTP